MSAAKPNPAKPARRSAKAGETYRGVRLQPNGGHSRFTTDQIKEAVQAAIVKNPDAFTRRG